MIKETYFFMQASDFRLLFLSLRGVYWVFSLHSFCVGSVLATGGLFCSGRKQLSWQEINLDRWATTTNPLGEVRSGTKKNNYVLPKKSWKFPPLIITGYNPLLVPIPLVALLLVRVLHWTGKMHEQVRECHFWDPPPSTFSVLRKFLTVNEALSM